MQLFDQGSRPLWPYRPLYLLVLLKVGSFVMCGELFAKISFVFLGLGYAFSSRNQYPLNFKYSKF